MLLDQYVLSVSLSCYSYVRLTSSRVISDEVWLMSTGQVVLSTWLFCASSLVSVFWWALMCETKIFVPDALFHMCSLKTTLRSASDLLFSSLLVFLFLDQVTMPLTTFQDLYFHFIPLLFPYKVGDWEHSIQTCSLEGLIASLHLQGYSWIRL